ncbi:MAG: hypothetical protein PHV13_04895 [Candidatus ainarchaeum sp.]|nr:hypothetical protein [Candidatus ainarchaeum sp.]
MEFHRILEASKEVMTIGIALVALDFVLRAANFLLPSMAGILGWIMNAYALILLVAFFCLYAWAGMRAVRLYKMDLVGAGLVAATAYLVTSIVNYILGMLGLLLLWGRVGLTSADPLSGAAFGGLMLGVTGILDTGITVFVILIGLVMNFVVGAGGGAIANVLGKPKKK